MILRRFVALTLLWVVFAFQAEASAGALRDGEVHHETLVAALSHQTAGAHHGHEDTQTPGGGSGSPHSHGSQHQHGTTGDHCTHQHLMGPVSSFALSFTSTLSFHAVRSGTDHFDRLPRALFRPPRA